MRTKALMLAALCLLRTMAHAQTSVPGALSMLESLGPDPAAAVRLDSAVRFLDAHMATGDPAAWPRLLAIVENTGIPSQVRLAVLRVVLEKADEKAACRLAQRLSRWCDTVDDPLGHDDVLLMALNRVMQQFSQPTWEKWVGADPATARLLGRVYLLRVSPETRNATLRALIGSPAPAEVKREVAEDIVLATNWTEYPSGLLSLLDAGSVARMRDLVRTSPRTEAFHFGAAAVLGHFGDRAAIPELRAAQVELGRVSPQLASYIALDLRRIDLQNPPANLLAYIASGRASAPDAGGAGDHVWAMERALDLGFTRERVRQAVLSYAARVPVEHSRDPRMGERTVRRGLASLKARAVELGVLAPTDLPDVKIGARLSPGE
jgi:hypothetical protein